MNGNRLSIITDEYFVDALTIRACSSSMANGDVRIMPERGRKPHKRAHLYLLALFSCLWQDLDEIATIDRGVIRLQLRQFARFMGMDAAAGKSTDIMAALATLEGYFGIFEGKPEKVLEVVCTEDDDHEVVLSMPYIVKVLNALSEKKDDDGELVCHEHISANVCKERCVPAVDLVIRLLYTLVKRGLKPHGKFKKNQGVKLADRQTVPSHLRIGTLIEDVWSVLRIADGDADTDNKNIQMRRVFLAADKILHEQTDIFEYYKGLQIKGFTAPKLGRKRAAAMDEVIQISHYGGKDETEIENAADQTTGGTTAG